MQPVRFDGTRDPRWVEAVGPTITYALEPCDYGPDPNAPTYTGPTYESWTDREYVYGTGDVDERNKHKGPATMRGALGKASTIDFTKDR